MNIVTVSLALMLLVVPATLSGPVKRDSKSGMVATLKRLLAETKQAEEGETYDDSAMRDYVWEQLKRMHVVCQLRAELAGAIDGEHNIPKQEDIIDEAKEEVENMRAKRQVRLDAPWNTEHMGKMCDAMAYMKGLHISDDAAEVVYKMFGTLHYFMSQMEEKYKQQVE